jgi:hypothetical protein
MRSAGLVLVDEAAVTDRVGGEDAGQAALESGGSMAVRGGVAESVPAFGPEPVAFAAGIDPAAPGTRTPAVRAGMLIEINVLRFAGATTR